MLWRAGASAGSGVQMVDIEQLLLAQPQKEPERSIVEEVLNFS